MPDDDTAELAKRIAVAYRSSGIPAKLHRGQLFVYRDEEWEGPFEARALQGTYHSEIQRVEQEVTAALAQCAQSLLIEDPLGDGLDREELLWLRMSPALFERLGLDDRKARFYEGVARQLRFRGKL